MSRVAIFVDAGYLFAQGSVALVGQKQRRSDVKFNVTAAISELTATAQAKCPDTRLLRIYWYDAPPPRGMSTEHTALAHADYVKLRLGVLNRQGQQKGVDSLIVTDMIELARNKSICDAVLLSGDEDVRIGVQIAQNFGVGVHLVGIHPARGSQSILLSQEADTTTEWDRAIVARFMSVSQPDAQASLLKTSLAIATPSITAAGSRSDEKSDDQDKVRVEEVIEAIVAALNRGDLSGLKTYWETGANGIPSNIDGPLLGKCRDAIGRDLSPDERRNARKDFSAQVQALIDKAP
jgi:uncharacterized LabA/DUF88 family protein